MFPDNPAGDEVGEWGDGVLSPRFMPGLLAVNMMGGGGSRGAFLKKYSCMLDTISLVSLIFILNSLQNNNAWHRILKEHEKISIPHNHTMKVY